MKKPIIAFFVLLILFVCAWAYEINKNVEARFNQSNSDYLTNISVWNVTACGELLMNNSFRIPDLNISNVYYFLPPSNPNCNIAGYYDPNTNRINIEWGMNYNYTLLTICHERIHQTRILNHLNVSDNYEEERLVRIQELATCR